MFRFIIFDCDCNEFSNVDIFFIVVNFCLDRDLKKNFDSIKKFVDTKLDINIVNEILYNSNDFVEINETIDFYFIVQLFKKCRI